MILSSHTAHHRYPETKDRLPSCSCCKSSTLVWDCLGLLRFVGSSLGRMILTGRTVVMHICPSWIFSIQPSSLGVSKAMDAHKISWGNRLLQCIQLIPPQSLQCGNKSRVRKLFASCHLKLEGMKQVQPAYWTYQAWKQVTDFNKKERISRGSPWWKESYCKLARTNAANPPIRLYLSLDLDNASADYALPPSTDETATWLVIQVRLLFTLGISNRCQTANDTKSRAVSGSGTWQKAKHICFLDYSCKIYTSIYKHMQHLSILAMMCVCECQGGESETQNGV